MATIEVSADITGDVWPLEPVLRELQLRFPAEFTRISSAFPRWPMERWSNALVLHRKAGPRRFLKGTPRLRHEAELLQELHALIPQHVPTVIAHDLLPDSLWRWFIMESAGTPVIDDNSLSFTDHGCVLKAVEALAQIQCRVYGSEAIPQLLPRCDPDRLRDAALEACAWYADRDPGHQEDHEEIRLVIERDEVFFPRLTAALSGVPSTVVHGDFWGGNMAWDGSNMRILDWADAVWGVGGISLVDLIHQHQERLSQGEAQIWARYSAEVGHAVDQAYVSACRAAAKVVDVVVHQQIEACCEVRECVPDGAPRTAVELAAAVRAAQKQ